MNIIKRLLRPIDNFLDRTTMYRLVVYVLCAYLIIAFIFSAFGLLSFSAISLVISSIIILAVCWITNKLFSYSFNAPANVESIYITALILALIITPPQVGAFLTYLSLAAWASVWAMASKYIFAIGKKHLFNPAAFGVLITAFVLNQSASWWIGTHWLMPFVLIGGILIIRKIRRADLFWAFFIAAAISILLGGLLRGFDVVSVAQKALLDSPLLFFSFVMITEPLTTPPTRKLRIAYGALVGLIFAPSIHIGGIYSTPELALIVGNVFSYLVSPKQKLLLKLKEKIQLTPDVFELVFQTDKKLPFKPGQYMEWTLAHQTPDNRGNRRYFTIASSPTEKDIKMGVKFYKDSSSYKNKLQDLKEGDVVVASQLAGDFVLPTDKSKKLVFLAGGIGVTPFKSMIQYMMDTGEKRPIVFLYSNKTVADIAYKEFFDRAEKQLGIKMVYVVGNSEGDRATRFIRAAVIDMDLLMSEVPDYKERVFYVSGPRVMVTAFQEILGTIGVKPEHIKTDFFPGFV